jgi:hypothetical protein
MRHHDHIILTSTVMMIIREIRFEHLFKSQFGIVFSMQINTGKRSDDPNISKLISITICVPRYCFIRIFIRVWRNCNPSSAPKTPIKCSKVGARKNTHPNEIMAIA